MLRYRVTWTGFSGSPYVSTFFADGDGTGTGPEDFRDALNTFLTTVDTGLSNALAWQLDPEVDVMDLDGTVTGSVSVTAAGASGGTSGQQLPHANQLLLRLRTGSFVGGRELRGKLYIPGTMSADTDSTGNPTTARINTVNAAAAALVTDSAGGWSVWSRKSAARSGISSATCAPFMAVLRSRRD